MNQELLERTARDMVRPGRGIFAADDSASSNVGRYEEAHVDHSVESRLAFRAALVSTPAAADVLSGVILHEETFGQEVQPGVSFPTYLQGRGILPGIKLDQGVQDLPGFPGEKVTAGLDTLPGRAAAFADGGARFAKWRNVIAIGDGIPTDECIGAATFVLARYARICQDAELVPIVEPEMLLEGTHSSEECEAVTARVYDLLFQTMRAFRVHLPGAIMKTSMVVPGSKGPEPMDPDVVADRTVRVLAGHVPEELGGVVFLSGGQTTKQAFANLNRIEKQAIGTLPYGVTFSYMRAFNDPALHAWGAGADMAAAQEKFTGDLRIAAAARAGELDESILSENGHGQAGKQGFNEY